MNVPHKRIWFCASNSTHVKMWINVTRSLHKMRKDLLLELVSLGAYYGGIDLAQVEHGWEVDELPRTGQRKLYWDCTLPERALAVLKARRQISERMQQRPPDLIILGNDVGIIEASIISTARSQGIKTLLVQDGILGSDTTSRQSPRAWMRRVMRSILGLRTGSLYGSGGTDAIAVMGVYALHLMLKRGVEASHIKMTGQPRFDALRPDRRQVGSAQLRKKLASRQSDHVLCIISQPMTRYDYQPTSNWNEIMETMLSVTAELSAFCTTVVRLHPADNRVDFQKRYGFLLRAGRAKLIQKEDIATVLGAVDVVLVFTSTVALEAMIYGKPVVMYSPSVKLDPYGFAAMHVVFPAHDREELVAAIKNAFLNNNANHLASGRRKAIKAHIGRLDGKASERVAQLALSMLDSS